MKKRWLIWFFMIFIVVLCGCQGQKESTADGNQKTESSAPSVSLVPGDCMPVLTITTNNRVAANNDFVTKPVARFVAEQIATWTPNYVMPPEPYYEDCKITLTDEAGTVALSNADGQVKVRGNWTTTYAKKPAKRLWP